MRIADILRTKGAAVATVTETTTVAGLLTELVIHNIGAMVVVGPDGVVGIVSERDVVRKLHEHGPDLLRNAVNDIMSKILVTCTPDDQIDDLSALMTNNRVRHVPVMQGDRLVGIVSIGDVVKNRMEQLQAEQEHLQAYITPGRLAPGVLGAQPGGDQLERRLLQDRALAADALLGDVEHPIQPHPAGPAVVVPAAGADADPVAVLGVVVLAGQHQAEQGLTVTADHQHRPVLAPGRVVLVDHPGPDDLARVGAAVEVGCVDQRGGRGARSARCCWSPAGPR